ncbi:hypothetical protein K0M31_015371 [Melipona bicolor]|uniref:Carboxylesterase type B domain-containing protein n=1 Tax=Melipona bicolor TaxID=60889 RepID=A0AA40FFJ7_9HYME|nr:hypothetical protein K0M31_015371 [Melipona bicolor]
MEKHATMAEEALTGHHIRLNVHRHTQHSLSQGMADNSRKHPVVLYIHGESYDWGSGNPYDGSVLASYTDQVIVTMNYRLGVLGFLNANMAPQTKARVANYGLMDQIAALQWVKEHIALFGGDPNNVTLMGQGTGAACVHFLAISPTVVRGLFKRAILLSGSALSSWAVVEDPVSYAMKLAKAVNCSIPEDLLKDNELIVDCLRDRSLDELMQVDIQPPTFLSAFGPSVDGVVIKPDFQKDLLSYMGPEFQGFGPLPKKAEHGAPITSNNKYDLLFGVTTSEALWKFAEKDVQQGFEGERRDRIIRTYVRNAYVYHLTEIFYTVVNEYTDWERTVQHPVNTKDACVQALSDAQFVAPLVQTGDLFTLRHTKKPNNPHIAPIPESEKEPLPKTYFYVFDYQMKDGDYPQVSDYFFRNMKRKTMTQCTINGRKKKATRRSKNGTNLDFFLIRLFFELINAVRKMAVNFEECGENLPRNLFFFVKFFETKFFERNWILILKKSMTFRRQNLIHLVDISIKGSIFRFVLSGNHG